MASRLDLEALASRAVVDSVETRYGNYQEPQISQAVVRHLRKVRCLGATGLLVLAYMCVRKGGKTGESVDLGEGGK